MTNSFFDVYCKSKGASPEEFDIVIENIRHACEVIKTRIRLNVPNNDPKEAIAIADYLLKERGLLDKINIYFAYICDYSLFSGESPQKFNAFIQSHDLFMKHIIEQYGMARAKTYVSVPQRTYTACGVIRYSNVGIGPRGELYKCHHDLGRESMVIGDIWNGRLNIEPELTYYVAADDPARSKCKQCGFLPVCMGGCANNRVSGSVRFSCEEFKQFRFKLKLLEGGVYL